MRFPTARIPAGYALAAAALAAFAAALAAARFPHSTLIGRWAPALAVALPVALPLAGFASCAYDGWRGINQPNRVSWFLWAPAPLITGAVQLAEHAGRGAVALSFALGIGPLLVFAATFLPGAGRDCAWKLT